MLHKGPSGPYKDDEMNIQHSNYPGNTSALEVALAHSHLYGPHLSDWIDSLVNRCVQQCDTVCCFELHYNSLSLLLFLKFLFVL